MYICTNTPLLLGDDYTPQHDGNVSQAVYKQSLFP